MALSVAFHILAAIIWIGGMFFAHMIVRPSVAVFEPAQRLALFAQVFKRFFAWVWAAVIALLVTGYWMIFTTYDGFAGLPIYLHLMHGIGWLMILLFMHLWFAPYRRFKQAMIAADHAEAGRRLGQIRMVVSVNLALGLINSIIGAAGLYL